MRRSAIRLTPIAFLALSLTGCATFGDFLADTSTYHADPNRPLGQSENMRRVQAQDSILPPVKTEPGNVWPTGIESMPTLGDIQVNKDTPASGDIIRPHLGPVTAPARNLPTNGPAAQGILVPNGNGTSTLIKPDGSVTTVPTPGK